MATKEDKSRVRLEVDGKQAINELGKLEMEAKELAIDMKKIKEEQAKWTNEAKNLDKLEKTFNGLVARAKALKDENKQGTAAYEKLQKRINQVAAEYRKAQNAASELKKVNHQIAQKENNLDVLKDNIKKYRQELGLTGMTMRQLVRYQKEISSEIHNTTTRGTERYRQLKGELHQVNRAIAQQRAELNGTKGFWGDMSKQLKQFGVLALSALGANAIFSQVQSMVEGSAKLSDALTDVQKTTGLTDTELAKLTQTLRAMNTRTPRSELLGLAEIAGRLGIQGAKDIEGFVRAADKINVALGDVLGDPEQVMRQLGKLTETFGIKDAYGIESALLRVGSAINELGMASTANEGYMVEFAKRLGGIAPLAGISIENVLGLGATLDSLGQTAEVSTTALSKLFIDMAKNAKQYARFANMEMADFVRLMNEDANEAFIRMLEGVKGNSNGITELAATLGDLGQDGGRVVGVLGTLANNTERLRQQQKISNDAFREGISVVNEFDLKNNNLAANLEKVQKWMAGIFVNGAIMEGINLVVTKFAEWVAIPLSETLEAERLELNRLSVQLISANTSTEDRIRIIKELQDKYPGFLSNMNAERVSNKELSAAIREVNEQLINKIIIQEKEEEIAKQNQRTARIKAKMLSDETKLYDEMLKVSEKFDLKIFQGLPLEDQARTLLERAEIFDQQTIDRHGELRGETANLVKALSAYKMSRDAANNSESEGNFLLEEKNRLMERLGIKLEETDPIRNPTVNPNETPTNTDASGVPGNTDEADKKLEQLAKQWEAYLQRVQQLRRQYELSGMEDQDREIAVVQDRYQELEAQLVTHLEAKAITEEQFAAQAKELAELRQNEISAINQKYEEKAAQDRQKAEQTILQATVSEQELARMRVMDHYDELIKLAERYGLDSQAIETARLRALQDLEKNHNQVQLEEQRRIAQAKVMIAQSMGEALGGVIDFVGGRSGELSTFQKLLVGAQIAMDSAAALGRIVPLAAEAASGTGPAAPWVFAGYIASMGATVLGAIGRAKKALSQSNAPEWKEGDKETRRTGPSSSAPVASYYYGGDTGVGSMGFGDRYGAFAGYVHKDEYVIPSFIRSHPYVANVLPVIEDLRQEKMRGFYRGGDTTPKSSTPATPPTSTTDLSGVERKLDILISKIDKMPTRMKAYLVDSELQEFREERDSLERRYSR